MGTRSEAYLASKLPYAAWIVRPYTIGHALWRIETFLFRSIVASQEER